MFFFGSTEDGFVEAKTLFIERARAAGDIVFDVPSTWANARRPFDTYVFAAGATEANVVVAMKCLIRTQIEEQVVEAAIAGFAAAQRVRGA
jgi:hypothetical protein